MFSFIPLSFGKKAWSIQWRDLNIVHLQLHYIYFLVGIKKKKLAWSPYSSIYPETESYGFLLLQKKMYWFWNRIALLKTWVVHPADSLQIQILLLKPWWLKQLGNYKQVAKFVPHLLIFKFKVRQSTLSQLLFFSGQAGCEWLRSNLSQTVFLTHCLVFPIEWKCRRADHDQNRDCGSRKMLFFFPYICFTILV